jgi:hypothetical protein
MSSQHRHSSARSVLLHERARVMRAAPTLSEARLWAQLSGESSGSRSGGRSCWASTSSTFSRPPVTSSSRSTGRIMREGFVLMLGVMRGSTCLAFACLHLEAELVTRELPLALERLRSTLSSLP